MHAGLDRLRRQLHHGVVTGITPPHQHRARLGYMRKCYLGLYVALLCGKNRYIFRPGTGCLSLRPKRNVGGARRRKLCMPIHQAV